MGWGTWVIFLNTHVQIYTQELKILADLRLQHQRHTGVSSKVAVAQGSLRQYPQKPGLRSELRMRVNLGVSLTKQPLGNMQDRTKRHPRRERAVFLSSFVLRVPGEHRMPQPENCLLQRPTCLGRSSSISSCASLSILRYRGRFLAFSSTVRTSGEGCVFTSHQLVPRKGCAQARWGPDPEETLI